MVGIDPERPITRTEVAELVRDLFTDNPISRETLIATARQRGARPEVIAAMEELSARRFPDMRQLWAEMPPMAVSA